jgi:hypothetical protein
MTVREIEKQLLKLDSRSRAKLAERLLHSLDELSAEENEQLWVKEAVRRHNELTSGRAKSRPAREVLREARARLR